MKFSQKESSILADSLLDQTQDWFLSETGTHPSARPQESSISKNPTKLVQPESPTLLPGEIPHPPPGSRPVRSPWLAFSKDPVRLLQPELPLVSYPWCFFLVIFHPLILTLLLAYRSTLVHVLQFLTKICFSFFNYRQALHFF